MVLERNSFYWSLEWGAQKNQVIFIYFTSLKNVLLNSNNRNSVGTLDYLQPLKTIFYHTRHSTNVKGNNFLPLLCLSVLLVTGMLVVTVGGVVLGELTVAGNKDEKDVILPGVHDS